MTERFVYRKLATISRDYLVERVENEGRNHFELTVWATDGFSEVVVEKGTVFNTKREADTGLLDRACLR